MFVRSSRSLMVLLASCVLGLGVHACAQEQSPEEQGVREALRAYAQAFNAHDAKLLSESWADNAIYVDRGTGERLAGRAALQSDFEALFKESTEIHLVGETQTVHFVTPDVAIAEGVATVSRTDEPLVQTGFTATLVRQKEGWKLHMVEESPVPQPDSATDALQELAWLVGDWVDDTEGDVRVKTSVNWADGDTFLVRSFSAEFGNGVSRQGTQLIGWDPRAKELRSWAFNADGSFGDGVWSKVGDAWHVKSSQTLANGDAASGTYVITPVDENTMTLQLIGHEIEGEPQPAAPMVTVIRAGSRAAAQAPAADPAPTQGASKGGAK